MRFSRITAALFSVTSIGLVVLGMWLVLANAQTRGHSPDLLSSAATFGLLLGGPAFAIVGAIIVSRYPRHSIGWIMVALGLSWGISNVAPEYGTYTYITHPHALPLGPLVASASTWMFMVNLMLFFWLTVLFPTGQVSGRWRALFWIGTAGILLVGVFQAIAIGPTNVRGVQNPFGIARIPDAIDFVVSIVAISSLPGAVWSALSRLHRSSGEERLQMEWFMYGASSAMVLSTFAIFSSWSGVAGVVATGSLILLPFTIGAAMLRYHLYDIHVLINRTLVYGSLTATLAALYLGGVVTLQWIARAVTGENSDLAVAVVTLGVAALFNPWRHRLQAFIDRRFYRRKYDAARVLATFTQELRDEVDLDHLAARMVAVMQETMQPASLTLWLAQEAER